MERHLAAILIADTVGYSRLLHADEAKTLAALKARRKGILEPLVGKHRGRLVKLMGDGFLVEFTSAVSAVQCAVELQAAMEAANKDLPADQHLTLRVGLDLGEVVIAPDDLYGHVVNVAARLEALAEPGAINVSQVILDQVRGKVPFAFEDLGKQSLKNIPEPVRVYRVARQDAPTEVAAGRRTPPPEPSPAKPSIVVLPFTNMSGDPKQDYLSDGITEDIITDLSQVSSIFVVARNTAFTYKGMAVKVTEVAQQLNVGYILQGSIRKAATRIRINVQLIDGATGDHLWTERYDRAFGDIFALQDDISRHVVTALKLNLLPEELRSIGGRATMSAEAYE